MDVPTKHDQEFLGSSGWVPAVLRRRLRVSIYAVRRDVGAAGPCHPCLYEENYARSSRPLRSKPEDPKKEEKVTSEAIHGIVPLQSD